MHPVGCRPQRGPYARRISSRGGRYLYNQPFPDVAVRLNSLVEFSGEWLVYGSSIPEDFESVVIWRVSRCRSGEGRDVSRT